MTPPTFEWDSSHITVDIHNEEVPCMLITVDPFTITRGKEVPPIIFYLTHTLEVFSKIILLPKMFISPNCTEFIFRSDVGAQLSPACFAFTFISEFFTRERENWKFCSIPKEKVIVAIPANTVLSYLRCWSIWVKTKTGYLLLWWRKSWKANARRGYAFQSVCVSQFAEG